MTTVLLTLTLLAAPPDDIGGPAGLAAPLPPLRRVSEIVQHVDELLRRELRAQSDAEKAAAAYDMTRVYVEVRRDPRLAVSEPLKGVKHRLWYRLTRIKKEIQAQLKREGKADATLTDEEVLALADVEVVTQSLADHLALAGTAIGGPSTVFGQANSTPGGTGARGGGAVPFDYGPALVDLIQRTIVPEFWDVQGGPGTIVYYRPLMCLVIRATSDIHHRIGGTLGALGGVR